MTGRDGRSRWAGLLAVAFAGLMGCGGGGSGSGADSGTGDPALIQASDLVYLGAFRVPSGAAGGDPGLSGYSYGGAALAYNPDHDSLFLLGHVYDQRVGEISIPPLIRSDSLGDLRTATVLQGLADITEGHLQDIGEGGSTYTGSSGVRIGGLLSWEGRLIGAVYGYYDAAMGARLSHFTSGKALGATGDFAGMFQVGTANPGFVGGYMAPVPEAWRSRLGGSALTGNACLAIINRSSRGPAATAFDPADLGVRSPVPGTMLVGYPAEHPTLGDWGNTTSVNLRYNMATAVNGMVFPEGRRSVLFFGRQGLGVPCYGAGTSDPALDRQPVPGEGTVYCYDPASSSKGCHAYPYASYVWAYDAEDLAQVKEGLRQPWEVTPYAYWPLELPFATEGRQLLGAAYDPATRRLYLSQAGSDPGGGYFSGPVIHVLGID